MIDDSQARRLGVASNLILVSRQIKKVSNFIPKFEAVSQFLKASGILLKTDRWAVKKKCDFIL